MADFDSKRGRENERFEGGAGISPILACCMIVDAGKPGQRIEMTVDFYRKRRHLPIVTLKRAA